jgi:AraC-like DNA-binding protein
MPAVAALLPGAEASQTLRRTLPQGGPWSLVSCRTPDALRETLRDRLVDAVVFTPASTALDSLAPVRADFPNIPWIAFAPFKPDDGRLLVDCHGAKVALVLVDGVDNAVAGELVVRASAAAHRRHALADAFRMLRLADPLQRNVWHDLLDRVDQPVRTAEIARRHDCSREHLSRQFGAGGAPNLKRVIDLTRVACAAALLANPGYETRLVSRILRFATPSHLSATARRIAGVSASGLAELGARGVLTAFARGKTRSRW